MQILHDNLWMKAAADALEHIGGCFRNNHYYSGASFLPLLFEWHDDRPGRLREQFRQVLLCVQTVCLRGCNNRIQDRAARCTVCCIAEKPILATDPNGRIAFSARLLSGGTLPS